MQASDSIVYNIPPAITEAELETTTSFFSSYEFWTICIVVLFGLSLLSLMTVLRVKDRLNEKVYTNLAYVIIIVTSAMFVFTAGFSSEKITALIGLFGTILGYVLGKDNSNN